MMDLKMEVYTPELELIGILESFDSVLWSERAFDAGKFSIRSQIAEDTIALLAPDNIIWIEGSSAGIIEHVEESADEGGNVLNVDGRMLTSILDRRILWGAYNLYSDPASIMRQLVRDCAVEPTKGSTQARKVPGLIVESSAETAGSIRFQKTGGSLLEVLSELGESNNVAFGVRFNAQIPQMEFWTRYGVNRSESQSAAAPVFYGAELDDILQSEYSYDSADYRNVALVAGEGEGTNRIFVTVNEEGESSADTSSLEPGKDYATKSEVASSIQEAIYESWEASY